MPKGIPLTEEEMARRRHEISHIAANLFIKQGFNETSMRSVAEAAGVGKSTIYDYFKDKDELILFMVEDTLIDALADLEALVNESMPAPEKLKKAMELQLGYLLQNKSFFLYLGTEAQRLGLSSRQRIQSKRHAYQDLVGKIIEQGIAEGAFREVNPGMAVKVIMALMTPLIYTSRPLGSPEEMLAEGMDIFLNGMRP